MTIVLFGLNLYFAATLGVSGLAKLENTNAFAAILRRHRILPQWSVLSVSRIFPWIEVAVALLLIITTGPVAVLTSFLVLLLFVSFLAIEITLAVTKRASSCGCYGMVYARKIDGSSIIVSTLLALFALLQLWLTAKVAPLGWRWRLAALALSCAVGGWLVWKMWQRQRAKQRLYAASRAERISASEHGQEQKRIELSIGNTR